MQDQITRYIAADGFVRIILAETTAAVEAARTTHGASSVATAAMGRTLTAALMLASELKGDGSISATIAGGGPIGKVCAVARPDGTVKVYASDAELELPIRADGKLDVSGAVGREGKLTVVRDLGLREPYVGQVNLVSGEIAEDFAMYLTASEQQPSLVSLGVLVSPDGTVKCAGGIIVQPMPGCPEDVIVALEQAAPALGDISRRLQAGADALLADVFAAMAPQKVGEMPVYLKCDCSRERVSRALITLGAQELDDMIEQDGGAEVNCHFCRTQYAFAADELAALKRAAQP